MSESDKEVVLVETQFNLLEWKHRLERHHGATYSWNKIAEGAGIHVNTVTGIATNESTRVDRKTITALVNFFRREGLDVHSSELFVDVPVAQVA